MDIAKQKKISQATRSSNVRTHTHTSFLEIGREKERTRYARRKERDRRIYKMKIARQNKNTLLQRTHTISLPCSFNITPRLEMCSTQHWSSLHSSVFVLRHAVLFSITHTHIDLQYEYFPTAPKYQKQRTSVDISFNSSPLMHYKTYSIFASTPKNIELPIKRSLRV